VGGVGHLGTLCRAGTTGPWGTMKRSVSSPTNISWSRSYGTFTTAGIVPDFNLLDRATRLSSVMPPGIL